MVCSFLGRIWLRVRAPCKEMKVGSCPGVSKGTFRGGRLSFWLSFPNHTMKGRKKTTPRCHSSQVQTFGSGCFVLGGRETRGDLQWEPIFTESFQLDNLGTDPHVHYYQISVQHSPKLDAWAHFLSGLSQKTVAAFKTATQMLQNQVAKLLQTCFGWQKTTVHAQERGFLRLPCPTCAASRRRRAAKVAKRPSSLRSGEMGGVKIGAWHELKPTNEAK